MHRSPTPSPLSPRPLLVVAAVLVVGGVLLHHDSARDTALFHGLNRLGTVWPALWAMLSVAGLGGTTTIGASVLTSMRTTRSYTASASG